MRLQESRNMLNSSIDKLDCPPDMEAFTNTICSDFTPVFDNFKKREVHWKFKLEKNLKSIGTLSHSENNVNKNKTFPFMLALSGFFYSWIQSCQCIATV